MKKLLILVPAFILLAAAPALAEDMPMDHSKMNHSAVVDPFAPSRAAMHEGMNVTPTGNTDKDFVANMIPHHEGAVAMAKVELDSGKDPELRKLAQDIIAAQEKEIAFMKEWQKRN